MKIALADDLLLRERDRRIALRFAQGEPPADIGADYDLGVSEVLAVARRSGL